MRFGLRELLVATALLAYYLALVQAVDRFAAKPGFDASLFHGLALTFAGLFVVYKLVAFGIKESSLGPIRRRFSMPGRLMGHFLVLLSVTAVGAIAYMRGESIPYLVSSFFVAQHWNVELWGTLRIRESGVARFRPIASEGRFFHIRSDVRSARLMYFEDQSERQYHVCGLPLSVVDDLRIALEDWQGPDQDPPPRAEHSPWAKDDRAAKTNRCG